MNLSKLGAAPQLGLFERHAAKSSPKGQRYALDQACWVDHFPGWLVDHESLFSLLKRIQGWEQRTRWMFTRTVIEPRLTAEFPILGEAPVDQVRLIGAKLSAQYGVHYDSAWLNLYRDHNDSTSWHADRPSCRRDTCIVPVLSLGATRRFLVRPKERGRSTTIVVASGDLVVMGGRCQRDWVHAVPKETEPAGARISVNFGSSFQATKES